MQLVLLCTGKESRDIRKKYSDERIRWIDTTTDEELACLYSGAVALVSASEYEGYFLPALEATACGCPVLATNTGALQEVLGNSVTFVEPTKEAWIDALHHIPKKSDAMPVLPTWNESAVKLWKACLKNAVS